VSVRPYPNFNGGRGDGLIRPYRAPVYQWRESGGSVGIFSPNAAYLQSTYPLAPGHSHVFKR
jgi:hypothetical protein